MADTAPVEIPKRALFKAAEVCDLLKLQPYVLRSWEAEFPDLGVAKSPGSPRVYRREEMAPGRRISGPAAIVEDETATLVTSSFDAIIAPDGAIILERLAITGASQ